MFTVTTATAFGLEEAVNAESAYGMADTVLSGFLQIVTHPKVFAVPSPLKAALGFVQQLRDRQTA